MVFELTDESFDSGAVSDENAGSSGTSRKVAGALMARSFNLSNSNHVKLLNVMK